MAAAFDLMGIGCNAVDYLSVVDAYPPLDMKVRMNEFTMQGGGIVGTALVAASRLGAHVAYMGVVGEDAFSRFVLDELEKDGVDTSRVLRHPGASARFAFIVVDRGSGKRTIFWTDKNVVELTAENVNESDIRNARAIHLDGFDPDAAFAAARIAREHGVIVSVDAEDESFMPDELVLLADIVIASKEYGEQRTGRADPARAVGELYSTLSKHGAAQIVGVTAGENGSFFKTPSESFHTSAFTIDVKDTTGCGDVFHGAFLFAYLRGWTVRQAAIFASAAAALKARKLGGRQGAPTFEEVAAFLKEQKALPELFTQSLDHQAER